MRPISLRLKSKKARSRKYEDIYARSQFLKARSLIGLNQDTRAQRVLDSVETSPVVQSDSVLKGYGASPHRAQAPPVRELSLVRPDGRRPSPRSVQASRTLPAGSPRSFQIRGRSPRIGTADETADGSSRGFESYSAATRKPAEPPKLTPTDRTAKQQSEYFAELISQLDQDRKKALHDTLSTLSEWKDKAPPPKPRSPTRADSENRDTAMIRRRLRRRNFSPRASSKTNGKSPSGTWSTRARRRRRFTARSIFATQATRLFLSTAISFPPDSTTSVPKI